MTDPLPAVDYASMLGAYVADVVAGRIVASKWTRLACERQLRDLRRAEDPSWPYVWSPAHVAAVCQFVERCPHVEGRWGSPTIRLQPWQVFVVGVLFGWRHRADTGLRRFTNLYLETGRKSAKSTLMAALLLFHLLEEGEPGAQGICGATTGQQARIVFSIAAKMIRRAAWLREAGLAVFANAITHEASDSSIRPVNARASTLDGLNPSCIVLDESHAQSYELHDVLKSAQGARPNPLMLMPTTAGYDQLSVGYGLRTQLTKVLQGIFDADHLFGVIYALDEGDDWKDERVWWKSNPSLGVTPTLDWMRQYCQDAQQAPGLEAEFRVKACSEWLHSASSWLSMPAWDACADATLRLEDFAGEPCWIGGDLAQLDDLAALAAVFKRDDLIYAFVKCFLPRDVVQERAKAVPAYRVWADAGLLVMTEGTMIDYAAIEQQIRQWCDQFEVKDICLDQFGSLYLAGNLQTDGFPVRLEPKNAKTVTPAARELEARIRHQRFRHTGDACFRWQASNAVVRRGVDDTLLPKKETAESPNKIDAIDALLQAIGGLLGYTPTAAKSFYDDPDFSPEMAWVWRRRDGET